MYQALYRKYRPKTFDDVAGQQSIVRVLKNSIMQHKFSHAYLFFGSRGTGKTSLSKIFARAVNCLDPVDGNPCGKCKNCLISGEKECVDILEIDAASNNGVDEIRDLRNKISLVPAELKYKVYIIDEVHMLSIGAFNALLKTLEEPPEHAIFILATTDPQKVPETIISRCQCFSFQRISINLLVDRLKYVCDQEKIKIDDDVLNEIATASDGGLRDSLGMLDKLSSYTNDLITMNDYVELNGLVTKNDLRSFADDIFSGNFKESLNKLSEFNNGGKNLIQILSQFMYYLRDILVHYYVDNSDIPYNLSLVEKLITQINEKMFDIKRSGNPKVYIEVLLLNFMSSFNHTDNQLNSKNQVQSEILSISVPDNAFASKNSISNEKNNPSLLVKEKVNSLKNDVSDKILDNSKDDVSDRNIDNSKNDFSFALTNPIANIDEIMRVRINNAFALANKQVLNHELQNLELLNDYTFDQQFGYLVCEILNSKFRVASEDVLVLSYEYDSIVQQDLLHLEDMENIYNKLTNSKKKFAIITDDEWNKLKLDYIHHLKNGEHYEVLEEPDKVFKKEEKDDIILNDAASIFGDVVEFD